MEVVVLDNAPAVADFGARRICRLLRDRPSAVLGLATGRTPVALYERLVRAYRDGRVSFRDVTTFNLDEYVGLGADDSRSFSYFMRRHLFDLVDIEPGSTHIPACPDGRDPRQIGEAYELAIRRARGIDLQLLGIGTNGHIGFNEATSSLASRTRVKTLAPSTIAINSRYPVQDDGLCPRLAVTMGIRTILDAKRLLLLASGESKAEAVQAAVEGPLSAMCPASALQMHPSATIVVDEAAGSRLRLRDYFVEVHRQQQQITDCYDDRTARSGLGA